MKSKQKRKSKSQDLKSERIKISLKKNRYEQQIKILKKRVIRYKKKLAELESIDKKPKRKIKNKTRKISIKYKIRAGNLKFDTIVFSKILMDLDSSAHFHNLKLRYELQEGCLEVILYIILSLGMGVSSAALYDFVKHAINRIREEPTVEITKVPTQYKEARAKEMHHDLERSYKGVISKESIEIHNSIGTRFKIRDQQNMDWSYDIFDNGDERSHN